MFINRRGKKAGPAEGEGTRLVSREQAPEDAKFSLLGFRVSVLATAHSGQVKTQGLGLATRVTNQHPR